jgi:hypothetical protein
MKFSTDLYDLIQKLSQTEKRYVKLFARAFSSKGTEKQLALFDAFDQQKEYDEEELRAAFAEQISAKNFHVAKNRLYQLILKALYQYHLSKDERAKLYQQLVQAEILAKKGLYEQAHSLIQKSIQTAKKEEYLPELIHAYGRELGLVTYFRQIPYYQKMIDEDWFAEVLESIHTQKEELNIKFLEIRTMLLTHNIQVARTDEHKEQLKEIQKHPYLDANYQPKSKKGRDLQAFVNAMLYKHAGDYEKACSYCQYFVDQVDNAEKLQKPELLSHISDLNNLMFMQLEGRFFEAAYDTVDKMRALRGLKIVSNDEHILLRINERVVEFQLQWFLSSKNYPIALHYLEAKEDLLNKLLVETGNFRQIVILYNMTGILIANGLFLLADGYLEQIFQNPDIKKHSYIYSASLILRLLIHFELENYQLLESMLLNSYRSMHKRNLLYESERVLIGQLKKWIRIPDKSELVTALQEGKKQLERLQEDHPNERFFLDQFDLLEWIDSKIIGLTMAEIQEQEKQG